MQKTQLFLLFGIALLLTNCATFEANYVDKENRTGQLPNKPILNTIYLVGDAGKSPMGELNDALKSFKTHVESQSYNEGDYTLFLGDNIYPSGLPEEGKEGRSSAINALDAQIKAVENFEGGVVFLPGNHDWYAKDGLEGLKRQEKYIEDALGENTFLPENGCPLETVEIGDDIEMIIIDTEWYLEDWENHPTINDECEIKDRERFFDELEGEIKKAQGKTIILAMHHPMYTTGSHGGFYHAKKHLYPFQSKLPLPILASAITQMRTQGGVSPQDRYNERYNRLMKRLEVLAIEADRMVIASGHEHTLQYHVAEEGRIKQIVSGSAAKEGAAALSETGQFTYGGMGFAKLVVYEDGSSWVQFFSAVNGVPEPLFATEVNEPNNVEFDISQLPDTFPSTIEASIYTKEETDKTDFFQFVWGENYRDIYSKKITVPVATLDTLYGGLKIVRAGGGHQTRSLRLETADGRELNLRALRKSPAQYMQKVVFKDNFIEDEYDETLVEDLILDFYTAAHPYAFMVVPDLADAARLFHTNPKIIYVPKHKYMGNYNTEYGDELYMIEERPSDTYEGERNFGYADDIESTHDIIAKIREDEEYKIDEVQYIRSRLFDMLIGDWDRHQDQWRWAQFDQPNGDKLYKPIPRDRDQVFSNFDGALLDLGRSISSSTKQLQVYDSELKDIRWMNAAGYRLDLTLIKNSDERVWIEQAKLLQEKITDDIIEKAFKNVPVEVQDSTLAGIKKNLKGRRGNLVDIAERYSAYLDELVVLKGTDKDDHITITRTENGKTNVKISRIKDGEKGEVLVDRTLSKERTNELWVYGLDDDDVIEVKGKANNPIYTRIVGGQNNDVYKIEEGRAIKVYDHKSKPNTIEQNNGASIKLTDDYKINHFDYKKSIQKGGLITPLLGYNPDDGLKLGLKFHKTKKGFDRNPFTNEHRFQAGFDFAVNGLDVRYEGEFAHFLGDWNFKVGGRYTNDNYTRNFFGLGNESVNNDETLDFDYNRVKMSIYGLDLGILKTSEYGTDFGVDLKLEAIQVGATEDRFITDFVPATNEDFYDRRYFSAVEGRFNYHSADDEIATSRGMDFNIDGGVRAEVTKFDNTYAFVNAHLGFYNSLSKNNKLVLKTDLRTQLRFGDDIEFYQFANIGGETGLRGYRNERFKGQRSLVGSADVRYAFDSFRTSIAPVQLGLFAGGDVGRVWFEGDGSKKWHNDYGGGFWVAVANSMAGTFNFFTGDDGFRFSFGFGVNF
ncbi:metallophosphoesterase [Winogradskyella maritima]|uniref:Metallophosphoesterase n=1 Tax=Winogradskyella maritima TaxID=1517766 RepID=A0ABV8AFY7_9FLAO|nr:metallophosphoesterase [Winogradskyella maritima]